MNFQNKVVVITGSTGELGGAVTQSFLDAQANVVGFGSRDATLQTLKSRLGANADRFTGLAVNVLDESSIARAVRKIMEVQQRIDMLINLVGGFVGGVSFPDTTAEQWDKMMAMNAKSVFLCCRNIFPHMTDKKFGRIINIAGKGGLQPIPGMSAYSASKAAVINLTQAIAAEGQEHNVTANVVIPSIIDTAANRAAMPDADFLKWVTPKAIAQTILFLCSDEAEDISGSVIPVYGAS